MKKYPFFFSENAVSIFVEIQSLLSRTKYVATPIFLCGFKWPLQNLRFLHGPNLAQKP